LVTFEGLGAVPAEKGMEVRDDDLRVGELRAVLGRDEVALAVVVVGVLGEQDAEAVADRDAGRDDKEGVGEPRVLAVGRLVERLPGDEHRHHHRLARPGGHLVRHAEEARVRVVGPLAQGVDDPRVLVGLLVHDLGDVDRRLDGLELAEEDPPLPVGVRPVGEQPPRRGGDARPASPSPLRDLTADAVDEVVRLDPVRRPLRLELRLRALLLRLRDRHEVRGDPPVLDDVAGDPTLAEPPVALGLVVGRVQDGVVDEGVGHGRVLSRISRRCRHLRACSDAIASHPVRRRRRSATVPSWQKAKPERNQGRWSSLSAKDVRPAAAN